ncbi:MAG TPA: dual specificity protein phosphatase family protein [Vicinamibacterales bacterium]|nr:dual specificity protein phosphatase family protein [Vicinamibacterales bacterium]
MRGRNLRTSAAAILLGLTLAMPAAGHAATADAALANIRIDNFGRVDDHYYRGGQPEGRDYADLKALGVKTVIDLTDDDTDPREAGIVRGLGMRFVAIPMSTHETPSPEKVAKFLAVVDDPASQPVYVHCVGGRHRTGVMTAAYRMTTDSWTADRAFSEMKQYKFGADFLHSEFKDFVYGFHPAPAAAAAAKAANPSMR